jgi:hypothetical protein
MNQFVPRLQNLDPYFIVVKDGRQLLLPPYLHEMGRAHNYRPVRLAIGMGVYRAGPHLAFSSSANSRQEHGFLPFPRLDDSGYGMGLCRQQGPLQVQLDYIIFRGDMQRFKGLPCALGN